MSSEFRILLIDDDAEMRKLLTFMLTQDGFEVVGARDAIEGLRTAYQVHPDAIILDVMMPEMDGFEACRRLREMTDAPVLMLTAKATDTEDVVRGFSMGADDYIAKPVDRAELISRLHARLRRPAEAGESSSTYLSPDASIILNVDRRELVIGGTSIYLPPKEFQVLQLLVRHPGQVYSPNAILAQVWGAERMGEFDLVKQCIYRLRKRIEPDPDMPRYIHSVRGEGYYFETSKI